MSSNNKKISIILIIIIPFLMGLGVDMYVPSLPRIAQYYHARPMFVEWTVGIYMFGYGIGQLILGVLSDWKGRKVVILWSAIIFSVVSGSIIITDTILELNILRFLQGISIAGLAVSIRAVLVDEFQDDELKKVSSYLSLSWSIGPIVGPFIGASLEKFCGWKSNFYLFCIYGLAIYFFTIIYFKESNKNLQALNIKVLSKKLEKMVKCKNFIFIVLISSIMYALIIIFNIVGPFIIEKEMGKSISFYGAIAMILGTAYFFGVILNRYLISKVDGRHLIIVGLSINTIIVILAMTISLLVANIVFLIVVVYLIFFFIGLIVPNSIAISMSIFKESSGLASSVFGVINGSIVFVLSNIISYIGITKDIELYIVYMILVVIALIMKINILQSKKV